MCGLKLIAIGRPGQETGKPIGEIIANKCNEFGTQPEYDDTARRTAVKYTVAMPTPQGTPKDQELVTNCRSCSNFVPGGVMMVASGWNAGYCRATGDLLLSDRLGDYASGCTYRSHTLNPLRDTDTRAASGLGLLFMPEYQDGFGKVNLVTLLKKNASDPQAYETDKPVGAKAAEAGVRAWRKIIDPEGYGPDLHLPIFDRGFFDPISASKVPMIGDDEHPEDYLDHGAFVYKVSALWTKLDETPAIWGPAGVGKTELFRHLGFLMGLPFERISITPSSEIDDLAGKPGYSPERGTFFTYGRVPRAWQRANVLCVDEPNSGPSDVWMFFRPLTDNSKQLVLDQNEGERISRHNYCFLGMAMNPAWDPRNTGVATLADADGRRLMHIFMDIPPADIERAILRKVLERDGWEDPAIRVTVDMVMSCAEDLRTLSNDGVIPVSWGLAHQIKVARAMRYFTPVQAYRIGVADSLEVTAQQSILDAVKSKVE